MRTALGAFLIVLISTQAFAYGNLQEVLVAIPPDRHKEPLPRAAIEYIVQRCQLGWNIDNPWALKDGEPIGASVSPDHRYCVLTRPYPNEGGSGWIGAAALIDSAGLRWTVDGHFMAWSRVSARGDVALVRTTSDPICDPASFRLTVLTPARDTLVDHAWTRQSVRPVNLGLGDVCQFSPDGKYLLFWGAGSADSSSTILARFDLDEGSVVTEDLGDFWVTRCTVSAAGAELHGSWRPYFHYRRNPARNGTWRVTWSPWTIEWRIDEPRTRGQ
jgi:hypothetical protein